MKYEYNGNLLEEDRIKQVAEEIVTKYPNIDLEKAKRIAMLEGKITDHLTAEDELNRLYNTMLINNDNKEIVMQVYNDFVNTIKNNYNKENITKYIDLIDEIISYFQDYNEFPIISDTFKK